MIERNNKVGWLQPSKTLARKGYLSSKRSNWLARSLPHSTQNLFYEMTCFCWHTKIFGKQSITSLTTCLNCGQGQSYSKSKNPVLTFSLSSIWSSFSIFWLPSWIAFVSTSRNFRVSGPSMIVWLVLETFHVQLGFCHCWESQIFLVFEHIKSPFL